jgi:hypothetical protein
VSEFVHHAVFCASPPRCRLLRVIASQRTVYDETTVRFENPQAFFQIYAERTAARVVSRARDAEHDLPAVRAAA